MMAAKMSLTQETILTELSSVKDPASGRSLVADLLISNIKIEAGKVSLTVGLITPSHPSKNEIGSKIEEILKGMDGVAEVDIDFSLQVPSDGRPRGGQGNHIRTAIAVASGKGGVGKTTVAVNLAVALAEAGARIGLLDADVYGPNVPLMMGVPDAHIQPDPSGRMEPILAHGVKIMSIGFLVNRKQPIIWRGPMLHSAIRQFVDDVNWGEIDYLIIDLPPGTGDAQLSMAQILAVTGGLIVTLPQQVSLDDARRGLEMFNQLQVPILGIVENMSYLELPDGSRSEIFGSGGGEKLASQTGMAYLAGIPMDPAVRVGGDEGIPIVIAQPDCAASQALRSIAKQLALKASLQALDLQKGAIPVKIVN